MMDRQDDSSSDSLDSEITLSRDALARRPSYRKILDDLSRGVKSSGSPEGDNAVIGQNNIGEGAMSSSNGILMANGYQISSLSGQNLYVSSVSGTGEDSTRKRQIRLYKNRMAAKECRRKKKEYVKCLENRVAVLENQNRALIEELKSLKELYCQKDGYAESSFL